MIFCCAVKKYTYFDVLTKAHVKYCTWLFFNCSGIQYYI